MTNKPSREALLELCSNAEEVEKMAPEYFQSLEEIFRKRVADLEALRQDLLRKNTPQSWSDLEVQRAKLETKRKQERIALEDEISVIEREFASHGRVYRWFYKGKPECEIARIKGLLEDRFGQMHVNLYSSLTQWQSLEEAMKPAEDVFYLLRNRIQDFYVHNPPESWKSFKGVYGYCSGGLPSWLRDRWFHEQIVPVDKLEDLKGTSYRDGNPWKVYLQGFTVEDISVFHTPESSNWIHENEGNDFDVGWEYLEYRPPTNDLLLTLNKIGKIPCFVKDNDSTTKDEKVDKREWKINPAEWQELIGRRVEIYAVSQIGTNYGRFSGEAYVEVHGKGMDRGERMHSNPFTSIRAID